MNGKRTILIGLFMLDIMKKLLTLGRKSVNADIRLKLVIENIGYILEVRKKQLYNGMKEKRLNGMN